MKAATMHTKGGYSQTSSAQGSCFSRAKCFEKLWKVELFRKGLKCFFPCQTRMKEMFHAVWEAGLFSTATAKMESVKKFLNSLVIISFYIYYSIRDKLAWSAVFLHFLLRNELQFHEIHYRS